MLEGLGAVQHSWAARVCGRFCRFCWPELYERSARQNVAVPFLINNKALQTVLLYGTQEYFLQKKCADR